MKVVIDTNILINAAGDENSYAFRIIREVIAGRIEAHATHQTMKENREMLKKLIKDRGYKKLLEEFFRKLKIVPSGNLKVSVTPANNVAEVSSPPISDPEDIKLFESAFAVQADYLITEDQEVLAVEKYHGTEVLSPKNFWAKYQSEKDDNSGWREWREMILGR